MRRALPGSRPYHYGNPGMPGGLLAEKGMYVAWCEFCHRRSYVSRKAAKRAVRPGEGKKQAMRCAVSDTYWHLQPAPEAR